MSHWIISVGSKCTTGEVEVELSLKDFQVPAALADSSDITASEKYNTYNQSPKWHQEAQVTKIGIS